MQSWQMSAIKEHEGGEKTDFYDQVYRLLTFFMGAATLFLILINKPVLDIYVGQEYTNAWRYSPPLMIAFFMGALGTFWGSFYIAAKSMRTYLNSAICGAMVNIVLNIILIIEMGTIGAAIATMVSYIVVMIIRMAGKQKEVGVKAANRQMISTAICLGIALISAYLFDIWMYGIGILNIMVYLVLNRKQVQLFFDMCRRLIYKIGNREKMPENIDIEKLKEIELELLDQFIYVCNQLNIKYYMIGGSLLGTVRHKGFIPWDDDIDVAMQRDDYDIFIQFAQELLPENIFADIYD